MEQIYILVIWTVVGYAGAGTQYSFDYRKELDWRPIGEFHAKDMCEDAARQLALKVERYRCVRSK